MVPNTCNFVRSLAYYYYYLKMLRVKKIATNTHLKSYCEHLSKNKVTSEISLLSVKVKDLTEFLKRAS